MGRRPPSIVYAPNTVIFAGRRDVGIEGAGGIGVSVHNIRGSVSGRDVGKERLLMGSV